MGRRNVIIDIAELVFSFCVVFTHATALAENVAEEGISPIFGGGYIAVEFFFIVSGYLMCVKADRGEPYDSETIGTETLNFLKGKLGAILPYYISCWVLSTAIYLVLTKKTNLLNNNIFQILGVTMAGFSSGSINGHLWYLSAMFLGMWMLYPLMRKNPDKFTQVMAPLLAIFIYGYFSATVGSIAFAENWLGYVKAGILRGIAGLCLGCAAYAVTKALRAVHFRYEGSMFLTILELVCYILPLCIMNLKWKSQTDFLLIIMFFIAVAVSFSGQSFTSDFFRSSPAWLGIFAMNLYFMHTTGRSITLWLMPLATSSFSIRLLVYTGISIGLAVINSVLGKLLKSLTALFRLRPIGH